MTLIVRAKYDNSIFNKFCCFSDGKNLQDTPLCLFKWMVNSLCSKCVCDSLSRLLLAICNCNFSDLKFWIFPTDYEKCLSEIMICCQGSLPIFCSIDSWQKKQKATAQQENWFMFAVDRCFIFLGSWNIIEIYFLYLA